MTHFYILYFNNIKLIERIDNMRKKNILNIISFISVVAILGVIFVCGIKTQLNDKNEKIVDKNVEEVNVLNTPTVDNEDNVIKESEVKVEMTNSPAKLAMNSSDIMDENVVTMSKKSKSKALNGKNLFIGDSRTVGLMEYGKIKNAEFFADTGMSVYNIYKKRITVPKVGRVSLEKLLSKKKYDRIYVMMGINEGGYDFNKTVGKYKSMIKFIMKKQPKAKIIIQANLHVTKKRSNSDKHINNKRINKFNKAIKKIKKNKKIFYIDANVLFDDKDGNLDRKKTSDQVHPYAKYYTKWGKWIVDKTVTI